MPILVHLTSAKNVKHILRTGIHKNSNGVYCMPVGQNYYLSHQWLRELRRFQPGPLVAIYFRLPDDEMVWYGHYGPGHVYLPVGEAVSRFMQEPDAQGYEIILPRSVAPKELHKVRAISQVLGWRYSPGMRTRAWCNCPACVSRGEYNSSKKREPRQSRFSPGYDEILTTLHELSIKARRNQAGEDDIIEIGCLLATIASRKAGQASDLLFLLDYPSDEVLEGLAELLGAYKGQTAKRLLQEVNLRRTAIRTKQSEQV